MNREEIQEGIQGILGALDNFHLSSEGYTKQIVEYLHSQGCVIKVDRELPEYVGCTCASDDYTKAIAIEVQQDMLKAGYVKVEPLVEE